METLKRKILICGGVFAAGFILLLGFQLWQKERKIQGLEESLAFQVSFADQLEQANKKNAQAIKDMEKRLEEKERVLKDATKRERALIARSGTLEKELQAAMDKEEGIDLSLVFSSDVLESLRLRHEGARCYGSGLCSGSSP
ncbi:hypothetical protein LJC24_02085 [Desulfococcaceae bacterium OttesenSCG-928-F15]|nr:hypothetical protein [Desulfococcaceae bacterium OttesenSCG-928-F15]